MTNLIEQTLKQLKGEMEAIDTTIASLEALVREYDRGSKQAKASTDEVSEPGEDSKKRRTRLPPSPVSRTARE